MVVHFTVKELSTAPTLQFIVQLYVGLTLLE